MGEVLPPFCGGVEEVLPPSVGVWGTPPVGVWGRYSPPPPFRRGVWEVWIFAGTTHFDTIVDTAIKLLKKCKQIIFFNFVTSLWKAIWINVICLATEHQRTVGAHFKGDYRVFQVELEFVGTFFKCVDQPLTRGFATLPYIKGLTEPLTRLLKKQDIQVTNKPVKTLQQEFPAPKFRPEKVDQCNVV